MGFSVDVTIEHLRPFEANPTSGARIVTSRDEHGNLVEHIALAAEAKVLEVGSKVNVLGHRITRYAGLRGPWDSSLEEAR